MRSHGKNICFHFIMHPLYNIEKYEIPCIMQFHLMITNLYCSKNCTADGWRAWRGSRGKVRRGDCGHGHDNYKGRYMLVWNTSK